MGMTNEEAIEMLKKDKEQRGNCFISDALDMAIKALEMLEEFERAQIITEGRLNGRTYAYKCGLEDGKRKALEQQSEDAISRQAVLNKKELVELEDGQSFYCISPEDVETLPSVTPQPKTGHWINKKPRWIPSLSMTIHDAYECSNCGQPGVHWWKHCIYCGSPMEIEEWMTGSCQKSPTDSDSQESEETNADSD